MKKILSLTIRIGQAAQACGMSAASIRYYEQQGLLSPATRGNNGYRTYSQQDVERLRRIRTCRSLDMSLQEIQQVLSAPDQSMDACEITSHVLAQHLNHVTERIAELLELKKRLEQLQALCNHPAHAACPAQSAMAEMNTLRKTPSSGHLRHL